MELHQPARPKIPRYEQRSIGISRARRGISQRTQLSLVLQPIEVSERHRPTESLGSLNYIVSPKSYLATNVSSTKMTEPFFRDSNNSLVPEVNIEKAYRTSEISGSIDEKRSARYNKSIQKSPQLKSYLEYLESSSRQDLSSFRAKIQPRVSLKPLEMNSSYNNNEKHWLDDFLPIGLKTISNTWRSRNKTLKFENEANSPKSFNSSSPDDGSELDSPVKKQRPNRRRKHVNLLSTFATEDGELELRKLAEEVANNYNIYKDSTARNMDPNREINKLMKLEGVWDVFYGKVYKELPLHKRIHRHMTESFENVLLTKLQSLKELSSFRRKIIGKMEKKSEIIFPRYQAYKRINEKLQEVNIELRVHEIEALEQKLVQAHDDFSQRKQITLRRIEKVNQKRLQEVRSQCYDLEKNLTPIFQRNSSPMRMSRLEEKFFKDEPSRMSKDAQIVHKVLNRVFVNWHDKISK